MFSSEEKETYGLLMCIQNNATSNLKLNLRDPTEIYTYMQHYFATKAPRSIMAARPEKVKDKNPNGDVQCLDSFGKPTVTLFDVRLLMVFCFSGNLTK